MILHLFISNTNLFIKSNYTVQQEKEGAMQKKKKKKHYRRIVGK